MLDVTFADDSKQNSPTRPRMDPLVSTGGIHVPGGNLRDLERALETICSDTGFPDGDAGEFKWSPGRDLWMKDNLVEEDRKAFYRSCLAAAADLGVTVTVVVTEEDARPATGAATSALDATILLMERVEWRRRTDCARCCMR